MYDREVAVSGLLLSISEIPVGLLPDFCCGLILIWFMEAAVDSSIFKPTVAAVG